MRHQHTIWHPTLKASAKGQLGRQYFMWFGDNYLALHNVILSVTMWTVLMVPKEHSAEIEEPVCEAND